MSDEKCPAILEVDGLDGPLKCGEPAGHDKPRPVQWFEQAPSELDYIAPPTPHRASVEWNGKGEK